MPCRLCRAGDAVLAVFGGQKVELFGNISRRAGAGGGASSMVERFLPDLVSVSFCPAFRHTTCLSSLPGRLVCTRPPGHHCAVPKLVGWGDPQREGSVPTFVAVPCQ